MDAVALGTLNSLFKTQNIKVNVKHWIVELICMLYFSLHLCKKVSLNFFMVVIIKHDGIAQFGPNLFLFKR